jgi:hypothetical protein
LAESVENATDGAEEDPSGKRRWSPVETVGFFPPLVFPATRTWAHVEAAPAGAAALVHLAPSQSRTWLAARVAGVIWSEATEREPLKIAFTSWLAMLSTRAGPSARTAGEKHAVRRRAARVARSQRARRVMVSVLQGGLYEGDERCPDDGLGLELSQELEPRERLGERRVREERRGEAQVDAVRDALLLGVLLELLEEGGHATAARTERGW